MTEDGTRSRVCSRLEEVRQEVAILWSTLTALHAALQCNRRNWELYQEALYGLLKQICLLQEELESLQDWLKRLRKGEQV